MRIGLVIGAAQIGGAERQVQRLAAALRDAGQDVTILALERPGRRRSSLRLDFESTPLEHLWHTRWLPGVSGSRLRSLVHRRQLELLHFYHIDAMALAGELRQTGGPLAVGSIRGLSFSNSEAARQTLVESLAHLHALTTNCRAIAQAFAEHVPESRLVPQVLPNLVKCAEPVAITDASHLRVLFVGTLKPVKNPLLLVEAAARFVACSGALAARFGIVGEGPLRPAMQERVRAAGLEANFEFYGALSPDTVPFAAYDVTVSTSRREGSSNSLLESLAHGVPVIGTEVGGTVELIRDSGGGVLVPEDDASALSDALVRFATEVERRRAWGEAGLEYISRVHAPKIVAAAHLALYRSLLAARPSQNG